MVVKESPPTGPPTKPKPKPSTKPNRTVSPTAPSPGPSPKQGPPLKAKPPKELIAQALRRSSARLSSSSTASASTLSPDDAHDLNASTSSVELDSVDVPEQHTAPAAAAPARPPRRHRPKSGHPSPDNAHKGSISSSNGDESELPEADEDNADSLAPPPPAKPIKPIKARPASQRPERPPLPLAVKSRASTSSISSLNSNSDSGDPSRRPPSSAVFSGVPYSEPVRNIRRSGTISATHGLPLQKEVTAMEPTDHPTTPTVEATNNNITTTTTTPSATTTTPSATTLPASVAFSLPASPIQPHDSPERSTPKRGLSMRLKSKSVRKRLYDESGNQSSSTSSPLTSSSLRPPTEAQMSWQADQFPDIRVVTDTNNAKPSTRDQLISELYSTERSYVRALSVLVDFYVGPLSGAYGGAVAQLLVPEDVKTLFGNLDRVYECNKRFLESLKEHLESWTPETPLGDTLVEAVPQFMLYTTFCNNHDASQRLLTRLQRKNKDFLSYCDMCFASPLCNGLKIDAMMIMPVQRIPRYVLLVKDIYKHTDPSHPDYEALGRATEEFGRLAERVNTSLRESESRIMMANLSKQITGLKRLDVEGRTLLREGAVCLMTPKKKCQLLLFNDIIVFATEQTNRDRVLSFSANKQVGIELLMDLRTVWLEDLFDLDPQTTNNDAFELYNPERPYTVYCGAENEKRLWTKAILEAIGKLYELPEEELKERTTVFTHRDGSVYEGQYNDSQRHGRGKYTRADGSVYTGEWVDNVAEGSGHLEFASGDAYEGDWRNGSPHGKGTMQLVTGDTYVGSFSVGLRHGPGKILYANGDKVEGMWRKGDLFGRATLKTNSSAYEGEWLKSTFHGKGMFKDSFGNVYSGMWKHGRHHGTGKMEYANGDVYEGEWEDGRYHGLHCRLEYANGDVYTGAFKEGLRDGKGEMRFAGTGDVYVGDYSDDELTGDGTMHYGLTGDVYTGMWLRGRFHGRGKLTSGRTWDVYEGEWNGGRREGNGSQQWANGDVYEGAWKADQRDGKGVFVTADGFRYDGQWLKDRRSGKGTYEEPSGGKYIGSWLDDRRNGTATIVSMAGTKLDSQWQQNRLSGTATLSYVAGHRQALKYDDGTLVSSDRNRVLIPPVFPILPRDHIQ